MVRWHRYNTGINRGIVDEVASGTGGTSTGGRGAGGPGGVGGGGGPSGHS
jgi:hypothetical protein